MQTPNVTIDRLIALCDGAGIDTADAAVHSFHEPRDLHDRAAFNALIVAAMEAGYELARSGAQWRATPLIGASAEYGDTIPDALAALLEATRG